jgi:hypothetical protein
VNAGKRTLLKSTTLVSATPPTPSFKFPQDGSKQGKTQAKAKTPLKPRLDFEHLLSCFTSRFAQGFDGQDFHNQERAYKEKAGNVLKDKLGKDAFDNLLREGHYAEVCEIAKHVLGSTNLVHQIEKTKLGDGIEDVKNQGRFANALYDLLPGSDEMEKHFTSFCDLLSEMGANKWPITTYYQFLASDGKWMFMKPSIMKRMADSLNIALNYKTEPNWLTYSKLQELADRVDSELRGRGLPPTRGSTFRGSYGPPYKLRKANMAGLNNST